MKNKQEDYFEIGILGKIENNGLDNRCFSINKKEGFYKNKTIMINNFSVGPNFNLFIEDQPMSNGYSFSNKFNLEYDPIKTTPAEVLELIMRFFEERDLI